MCMGEARVKEFIIVIITYQIKNDTIILEKKMFTQDGN